MSPTPIRPSASGARLSGDDFQHVLTWLSALELLKSDTEVSRIEFEADRAGNVDDLVVHKSNGRTRYRQIKFVVDQQVPLSFEWFTTPPKRNSKTPLTRFFESYLKLTTSEGERPELALDTNRLLKPGDPILCHISGRNGKVVPRLSTCPPRSASGRAREQWADHLGITEQQLLEFLEHLSIRPGQQGLEDLEGACGWAMRAVGFRDDLPALFVALGALRKLIGTGVRELDAESLRELAHTHQLVAATPRATLLVQSLVTAPWPEAATANVDWVDLFDGDTPSTRRQLRDPAGWNQRLKPELIEAVDKIIRAGLYDVDVCGTMRLPCGLLVGQQLSDVAGFSIAVNGRDGRWSSSAPREAMTVTRDAINIDNGQDWAVAVAISQPIAEDVASYIRDARLPIGKLVIYSPTSGPSTTSVGSPTEGLSLAAAISAALRADTRNHRDTLHIFLACPLPVAILLGHLWNRMPATQIYEDLGPGAGYAPAFVL